MKKSYIFIIIIIIILTILSISSHFLSKITIPGVIDVNLTSEKQIIVGEGEVCRSKIITNLCEDGMICVNKYGEENFNSDKMSGWCRYKDWVPENKR